MNRFVIETLDCCKFFHNGIFVQTRSGIKEICLADVEDWGNISYVEYALNAEPIRAGAKGFFIVPAGHSDCENKEYSLGFYRERKDGTWIFRGAFMPLYGYCVDGMTNVFIVTGMPHDCAFVVSVKDNQYTFSVRFEINGKIPYESIKLQIHTFPSNDWADIANRFIQIIREVYGCERVYMCTMCDGPNNHYHIQLIPRYTYEKRGSRNFVKERKAYLFDKERYEAVREQIAQYAKEAEV